MAISNLLTGRVRVVSPKNVTSDRYQFLDLSQAEPNLGVPNFSASLLTNPAIVVSDSEGNRGFAKKLFLEEFSGSFSGSFQGDGSKLTGVKADVSPQISSGSATASISPNKGLQINVDTTIAGNLYVSQSIHAESLIVTYVSSSVIYSSGSNKFGDAIDDKQEFTGSVEIKDRLYSNEITASSALGQFTGSFYGDGRDLFNLPQATKLSTGSITASVAPQYGFKVESSEFGSEFTGSVDITGSLEITGSLRAIQITGSVSGSFTGDGAGLFNIPRSAFTGDAFRIASGSATASISPNRGLEVNTGVSIRDFLIVTSSGIFKSTVTASMFSGSGKGLFDIPISALSQEVFRIASGSVTASASPNFGFRVESATVGSQITGSMFVTGNIQLGVGAYYSGSGEKLFNIPRSALTPDALVAALIASGSVTASTTPDFGFKVISAESGSQFTGSLFVSGARGIELTSGSSFSGSGARLFDIPVAALRDLDLTRIKSGSATASISPNRGFEVNIFSAFTGSMIVSASVKYLPSESIQTVFNVTNNGSTFYVFSGAAEGQNPSITLVRGITYRFNVNASGHPFYIKTMAGIGTGNQYTTGVTNNGASTGTIIFDVPLNAPSTLYYNCQFHSAMAGAINVVDAIVQRDSGVIIYGDELISGSLNVRDVVRAREFTGSISASFIQGDGSGLYNIPRSAFTGDSFRIASGSVTASVSPAYGFKVETTATGSGIGSQFTGSISVSGSVTAFDITASFFVGDGSKLTNINVPPQVATRISTGSVTASVDIARGFIVQSLGIGSEFTGSIRVSGSVEISSGSSFSGSGERLFNIPRTALTPDALLTTFIASGSVTASVAPNVGFDVKSSLLGSRFSGSIYANNGINLMSGSYSGSGRQLFDIPRSAISDLDTSKIFSGSATASISPNRGFEVFAATAKFSSSISASVFSGSGAGLTDIPFSALSQELFRIVSGSVTASVSPGDGFRVISLNSGSQFTGSLFVTGGYIRVATGSFFSGSGAGLLNIPRSALNDDALTATEIKSGSVTASVSPNFGFRVESALSGSQFTGSLFVTGGYIRVATGSFFSGSGKGLLDIPRSALSPDALLSTFIASGSVTASVAPNTGFVVNSYSTISGSFIVSSSARALLPADIDTIFNVTNDGVSAYNISNRLVSGSNPTLTLVRGINYTFNVNAPGHPFWIKDASSTGITNAYNYWVTNNGEDAGTITFLVSGSAPDTLYYNCQLHSAMAGTINVVDALYVPAEIKLIGETKVEGNVTASMFSGSGK